MDSIAFRRMIGAATWLRLDRACFPFAKLAGWEGTAALRRERRHRSHHEATQGCGRPFAERQDKWLEQPHQRKKGKASRWMLSPFCGYGIDRIVEGNGLAVAASVLCKVRVTVDITLWIRPYVVASVVADRAKNCLCLTTATEVK